METLIILGIIAFIGYFVYRVLFGTKTAQEVITDINTKVVGAVVKTADINKDGKVDNADAAVVVKEVKRTTKKVAAKVKTVAKKAKGVK